MAVSTPPLSKEARAHSPNLLRAVDWAEGESASLRRRETTAFRLAMRASSAGNRDTGLAIAMPQEAAAAQGIMVITAVTLRLRFRFLRKVAPVDLDPARCSLQILRKIGVESSTNALLDRKVGVVVSLSGATMLLGLMPWLVLVLVLVALVGPKIMHLILHFQLLNVPVVVDYAES